MDGTITHGKTDTVFTMTLITQTQPSNPDAESIPQTEANGFSLNF